MLVTVALALCLLANSSALNAQRDVSRDIFAQQNPHVVLVHEVTSLELSFDKLNSPTVLVKAYGKVMTGGYTTPRLDLVRYLTPPADGIQELMFHVNAPAGFVTQAITEIETPLLRIENIPNWFRGVWAAPGSEDTELGVLMEPEVGHGEAKIYTRVQA